MTNMDALVLAARYFLYMTPFLLFALLNTKANLKKQYRSRQFLMPLFSVIYCLALIVFLKQIGDLLIELLNYLPVYLEELAAKAAAADQNIMQTVSAKLSEASIQTREYIRNADPVFLLLLVSNTLFLFVHVVVKRILVTFLALIFRSGGSAHDFFADIFYVKDEENAQWYIREHFGQARTLLKNVYTAVISLSVLFVMTSCFMYREEMLAVPFYPVFGVIIIGELYFFLDGLDRREMKELLTGEADNASNFVNYAMLRKVLVKLFGDKLGADNTTIDTGSSHMRSHDELLMELEQSEDVKLEAYGHFMRAKAGKGFDLDHNYLESGRELLCGNSILFNNPFYYDLIPYVSYPMNRTLLRHKKVLIVLGRHGIEEDVEKWCRDGLSAVTGVPALWNIGLLTGKAQDLDVGIIARSSVHDMEIHESNRDFFREVEFVMIVEPSKLITTAQVGLNSLVRQCRSDGKNITYCSTDKNCDGLVDALSHILLTNLTEVSATNHHRGISSYMCWETDSENLQHRLLPNLSRYLGMGTELSFAALKNQVSQTHWYGGEAFPVLDIHWIAKQYYYDLLHYANLPASQESMDEFFKVSPNLWNARIRKNQYMTVEDESCNMFEVKREFSTRAQNQGFINIISPEYLLKDYMAENDAIFNADPKAIPYIVADYAPTVRNVVLRLCLQMSAKPVSEKDIRHELMLIDVPVEDLKRDLWHEICKCCCSAGTLTTDKEGKELLTVRHHNKEIVFNESTLSIKRRFSMETGKMENLYCITDEKFVALLLGDLQNAGYISEDEKGDKQYLGTELRGHIFQKYLPGQFFTFSGKYYEMLRVTGSGQVLVRRAADHITGRPSYRQERHYFLSNLTDSGVMGDCVDIGGLRITKQIADIRVETPAYWNLSRYNDFASGRKVVINGIPSRSYCSKQVLRIDLPEEALTDEICDTITLLFNETFRTLFAENHAYIAAVTPGSADIPTTYSLEGENGCELGKKCIYIIEDSQLDLGLLVAVQRNLNRIFAIICDYLDWHMETYAASLYPDPAPEVPDFTVEESEVSEEEPRSWWQRLLRKIRNFFKKLFGKKKKSAAQKETSEPSKTEESAGEAEPAAEPAAEEETSAETETTETETVASEETAEEEVPVLMSAAPSVRFAEKDSKKELVFEPIASRSASAGRTNTRRPYHERCYLLFGSKDIPACIDISGTLGYLKLLGFGNSELEQVRKGTDTAEMIAKDLHSEISGGRYCDFCGSELMGTEFEILADGRERCTLCGKTAVKTEEEFCEIYRTVIRNLDFFFGVKINVPVQVKMVNAKKLHKQLGKTFIPTGQFDGRILGVAIRSKNGYSILVENGAPRMQSTMTIAHELVHIWQYLNWNSATILRNYGKAQELEVYEGMAKWAEIQYAYLIGEYSVAKREELLTLLRKDAYGTGFRKYLAKYPLSTDIAVRENSPFSNTEKPL